MKSDLYFTKICFQNKYGSHEAINALLDTGAANSLIHESVARRLNLDFIIIIIIIIICLFVSNIVKDMITVHESNTLKQYNNFIV